MLSDVSQYQLAGLDCPGDPLPSMLRVAFEEGTKEDETLKAWRDLATARRRASRGMGLCSGRRQRAPVVDSDHSSLPSGCHKQIMSIAQDNFEHMSDKRTRHVISRKFVWPGMARDVSLWCRACTVVCQRHKPHREPMCQTPILTEPFESVAIDLVGPFPKAKGGYRYLLTLIDLASRYPEALLLKTITAEEVADGLVELFCRHGVPRRILSDQGKQFKSALFQQLCAKLKVDKFQSSPYHPHCNGVVERFHGTLVPMLQKALSKKVDWAAQVKYCLFAIRCAPNRSTGYSPFEILLGRDVRSPLDLIVDELGGSEGETVPVTQWIHNLNAHLSIIRDHVRANGIVASDSRKEAHDRRTRLRTFKEGTMVLLRIEENSEGPFEVDSMPNAVNVKLRILGRAGKARVVHVNNVKELIQERVVIHRLVVSAEENIMDVAEPKLGGDQMDASMAEDIDAIKTEWAHVLNDNPGNTSVIGHVINTGDARPIRSQLYLISPVKLEGVKREITDPLELGVIAPSTSPWSSPVVPIIKPDKSIRLCIYYCKINSVTVPDPYTISRL